MTFKSSLTFARSLIFPKIDRNSSARKSILGAMLCIGLSIVPLIVVIAVTDGMINGMTERIIGLSSNNLQAYVSSRINEVSSAALFKDYAESILSVKGVNKVYPEIDVNALAAGKTTRSGIELRGVSPDIFQQNKSFQKLFTVCDGNLDDFYNTSDLKQAVIGKKMAENLELAVGDTFRIITTKSVGETISPKLSSFKITAIVSSGYQELDQFWVFIPLESCYKNLSLEDATYNVMIETDDPFAADLVRIQRDVKNYLGRYANVYRWDEIHTAEFENFSSTKVMLIFVMLMIVLVASVNISSAIVMLVMERQKEIAILKSIGATPRGITVSFLMAALACGIGGIIFGVPVGILLTIFSNQLVKALESIINSVTGLLNGSTVHLMDPAYYLSEIPVTIPWIQIIFVIIAVLILSLVVSYLPARKAGKEKPLDILRKN